MLLKVSFGFICTTLACIYKTECKTIMFKIKPTVQPRLVLHLQNWFKSPVLTTQMTQWEYQESGSNFYCIFPPFNLQYFVVIENNTLLHKTTQIQKHSWSPLSLCSYILQFMYHLFLKCLCTSPILRQIYPSTWLFWWVWGVPQLCVAVMYWEPRILIALVLQSNMLVHISTLVWLSRMYAYTLWFCLSNL